MFHICMHIDVTISSFWTTRAFPPFQMGYLKPFLCQHQIAKLNIWEKNVLLQPFLINMNK
jgi:hypothetical protein